MSTFSYRNVTAAQSPCTVIPTPTRGGNHYMNTNGEGFRPQKWDPEELARLVKLECETMGKSPEQLANDKLIENVAFAVDSIVWLAMYSDNERTRFDAAKYIVEQVIGKADTSGVAAEKTEIFEDIMQGVVLTASNNGGN